MTTIGQAIEAFKSTVTKNYNYKPLEVEKTLKSIYFDDNITENTELRKNKGDEIRASAIAGICSITRKSMKESKIFNDFFKYLKNKKLHPEYSINIEELPRQLSPLERQISILKSLHAKEVHKSEFSEDELCKEYLVSLETIKNDLCALRAGIGVLDQRLSIEYKRANRHIRMKSTAHPLFLVQNLTQIIIILEGLRQQSKSDEVKEENAMATACSIWNQLSDYATERILDVLCDKMKLDKEWYSSLSQHAYNERNLFLDERTSATYSKTEKRQIGNLLYCFKAGYSCMLTYRDENGNVCEIQDAQIVQSMGEKVEVKQKNGTNTCEIVKKNILEVIPFE